MILMYIKDTYIYKAISYSTAGDFIECFLYTL